MTVQAKGAVLSLALTSVTATMFYKDNCVESFKNESLANIYTYWSFGNMIAGMFALASIYILLRDPFNPTPNQRRAILHPASTFQYYCFYATPLLAVVAGVAISYSQKSAFDDLKSKCVVTM